MPPVGSPPSRPLHAGRLPSGPLPCLSPHLPGLRLSVLLKLRQEDLLPLGVVVVQKVVFPEFPVVLKQLHGFLARQLTVNMYM